MTVSISGLVLSLFFVNCGRNYGVSAIGSSAPNESKLNVQPAGTVASDSPEVTTAVNAAPVVCDGEQKWVCLGHGVKALVWVSDNDKDKCDKDKSPNSPLANCTTSQSIVASCNDPALTLALENQVKADNPQIADPKAAVAELQKSFCKDTSLDNDPNKCNSPDSSSSSTGIDDSGAAESTESSSSASGTTTDPAAGATQTLPAGTTDAPAASAGTI